MDNQVRLLPALIGAAAVLAALRLGSLFVGEAAIFSGSGTAVAADAAAPAAAPSAAPTPTAPASAAPAPAAPAAATPAPAAPAAAAQPGDAAQPPSGAAPAKAEETKIACEQRGPGQAQNKGEADVLHGLSDRRAELDARENDLALREQLLAATEKQVGDKIAELKLLQGKLDTMLAVRDDAQKAQLNALVKMYENMKPADAAKIFDKLDRRILTDVASGMKPVKVGAVLAAMDTEKAQELTALLASRLVLPQPVDVSAATPPNASAVPSVGGQAPNGAPTTAQPATPTAPAG